MPANPADQLKELQAQLNDDLSKNADLSKEIDRLKAQIADLAKTVSDIDAKSKAYDKSMQAATQQKTDLDAYVKDQKTALEAAVSNKDAIIKAKQDALDTLAKQAQAVTDAQAEADKQQQAWNNAKIDKASKQAAYDKLAGLAAANDAVLADATQLRAAAEKERAANNVGRDYFEVLVLEDVLKKPDLRASDQYKADLTAAASDLATANGAEKLAKDTAAKAATAAQQAQKDLDTARASWRQQVHDAIPVGNPPAAGGGAPAPGGGAPAPGGAAPHA